MGLLKLLLPMSLQPVLLKRICFVNNDNKVREPKKWPSRLPGKALGLLFAPMCLVMLKNPCYPKKYSHPLIKFASATT
jgi:hypothetical protein